MGSKGGLLFRSADDPNELLILLEVEELAKARQFTGSADLEQTMKRAGVSDRPDIYFFHEADRPARNGRLIAAFDRSLSRGPARLAARLSALACRAPRFSTSPSAVSVIPLML